MAKIVITGVAGFLGSHLADVFLADGHEVVGADNLIGGYLDNVPGRVTFMRADCNDWDSMELLCRGADVVYHCAATAYEGFSVFSPGLITTNIAAASANVFSAAIRAGVRRIVFCSSMARYGKGDPPFAEDHPTRPQDPYGINKVAAEDILKNLCKVHGTEYVIAVPHNIYGPRQKYNDPYRNVASIIMNRCLHGRPPIIYGDGTQQRCFSYIDDCLSCLKKMAFDPVLVGQTINIGPDEHPISINELCYLISRIAGYEGAPVYYPDRPQEVKVALCSSDKARRLLDYETKTSLNSGLHLMWHWMNFQRRRPFEYHLHLEIEKGAPETWLNQVF